MRGLLVCLLLLMLVFGGMPGSAGPPEAVAEGVQVPLALTEPLMTGPFAVGLDTKVEDLGRMALPRGFERFSTGEVPDLRSVLVQPTSSEDDETLVPSNLAYPWPADDVDGDGVEDLYMVEWPDDRPREETTLRTLSGEDGAQSTWTEEADWIFPPMGVQTDQGMLQITRVNEQRMELEEDHRRIFMWDGRLVVRDPASGSVLWERPYSVEVRDDGSGSIGFYDHSIAGPLIDGDGQVVLVAGTYEWSESIFDGTVTFSSMAMVDLQTGQERYQIPLDLAPLGGYVASDGAAMLYGHDGSKLRLIDASDGSLAHEIDLGFPIKAVRVARHAGEEVLLVHSGETERKTHVAVVTPSGSVLWNQHLPVTQFMYPIGELDGSSRVGFAQIYLDCVAEVFGMTIGTFEIDTAAIAWQQNRTLDWTPGLSAGLSLSVGDLDGDGLGEPSMAAHDWGYKALIEEYDLCEGWGSWTGVYEEDPHGNWTVYAGSDGAEIFSVERGELPGAAILGTLDPTARVRTIPLFDQRVSSVYALKWQELRIHAWDFENDTYRSTLIDAHAELSWRSSWRWAPVGFFSGPLDRVYIYWSSQSYFAEDAHYRRYAVSVHDAHTSESIWRFDTPAPYDVPIPEEATPLPGTPFER